MGLLNLIIESCIESNENPFKIPIFRFCPNKIGGYFFFAAHQNTLFIIILFINCMSRQNHHLKPELQMFM